MKFTTVSILVALACLAGCGIKPGEVSAPPHMERDPFPHTYPDPSTDP